MGYEEEPEFFLDKKWRPATAKKSSDHQHSLNRYYCSNSGISVNCSSNATTSFEATPSLIRSFSQKNSISNNNNNSTTNNIIAPPRLSKSASVRSSRTSTSTSTNQYQYHGRGSAATSPPSNSARLRRSSSTHHYGRHENISNYSSPDQDKSPPLIRSLSKKGSAFTKKCSTMAKEQKARFYIMRRCVAMLVCWRKHHRDS